MLEGEQGERKGFSCVEERGILERKKKKKEKNLRPYCESWYKKGFVFSWLMENRIFFPLVDWWKSDNIELFGTVSKLLYQIGEKKKSFKVS